MQALRDWWFGTRYCSSAAFGQVRGREERATHPIATRFSTSRLSVFPFQDWTAFVDAFVDTVHAHGLAAGAPPPSKV